MSDSETTSSTKKSTKSLGWMPLLVVVGALLLASLFLMPWFWRGMSQSSAAKAVKQAGGSVSYGMRLQNDASYVASERKRGEKGLVADLFGDAFVEQLTQVLLAKKFEDATLIPKLSKLPKLEVLDLSNANVVDNDVINLGKCQTLRKLLLDDTSVTGEGLNHLSGLPDLWCLGLDNLQIGDAAVDSLGSHTNLKRLYLDKTKVTNKGVGKLTGLSKLMGIGLQGTEVTDDVMEHLTKFAELDEVRLGDTAVTDFGVPKLASLSKLKTLNLENTDVTETGLTWMAGNQTLEFVDLSGTKVSDAVISTLADLPKLSVVFLHRTSVSRRAWNELRQQIKAEVQHADYSEKAKVD